MKLNGIFGTGSGKVGNAVFATSAGQQIVRPYQSKVTNPNTEAQVQQRAKFKLLSQLAAAMAPVIVIPKEGLVSSRNRFVKKNIPLATYADDKASIELTSIQLSDSNFTIPNVTISSANKEDGIDVKIMGNVVGLFEKIRYALFKKTEDDKLQLLGTTVVNVPTTGTDVAAAHFEEKSVGDYVVYAYGMNPKNASATVGYNNYVTDTGGTTADLESSVRISTYNYNFSVTKADEIQIN